MLKRNANKTLTNLFCCLYIFQIHIFDHISNLVSTDTKNGVKIVILCNINQSLIYPVYPLFVLLILSI